MKFETKTDVEAPGDVVRQAIVDFEAWERYAMRRGAEVSRTDRFTKVTIGMGWLVRFRYRGKEREIRITLKDLSENGRAVFNATSPNVDSIITIEPVDMTARRSRLLVATEVTARSLGARLFLQSLRLAKGRMDKRFARSIQALAKELELRHQTKRI